MRPAKAIIEQNKNKEIPGCPHRLKFKYQLTVYILLSRSWKLFKPVEYVIL